MNLVTVRTNAREIYRLMTQARQAYLNGDYEPMEKLLATYDNNKQIAKWARDTERIRLERAVKRFADEISWGGFDL